MNMPNRALPYEKHYEGLMESIHHAILYCYEFEKLRETGPITERRARGWVQDYFKTIRYKENLLSNLGLEVKAKPNGTNSKLARSISLDVELRLALADGKKSIGQRESENAVRKLGAKVHSVLYEKYVIDGCVVDVVKAINSGRGISEESQALLRLFKRFAREKKRDKHLGLGLSASERTKKRHKEDPDVLFPRLSGVVVQAFREAWEQEGKGGVLLPSPFYVLCSALTVVEQPHTGAYAFQLCRAMLQSYFKALCIPGRSGPSVHDYTLISEDEVIRSITGFRRNAHIQGRWPRKDENTDSKSDSVRLLSNYLVGHILATKGILQLWFEDKPASIRRFFNYGRVEELAKRYFPPSYHFRLSPSYRDVPQPGEVINMMFGIPMPFRGGETVFLSGLKTTTSGGLVVSLSGEPGAGKTSTALALAAQLSPLGTKTYYLSLEEEVKELEVRLSTLIPEHLKELSIFQPWPKWFKAERLEPNLDLQNMKAILEELKRLYVVPSEQHAAASTAELAHRSPCEAMLVIDNINELVVGDDLMKDRNKYEDLETFVKDCRDLGVLVILVSAADIPKAIRLDYLVDVSIMLRQQKTDDPKDKPVRLFQLLKTRHQMSRQGSHVFHISGAEGLRISPQIPSEMDRKQIVKNELFDSTSIIHALNLKELAGGGVAEYLVRNGVETTPYLNLFGRSKILIHGFGSSGKAGFGLKLLLSPPLESSVYFKDKQGWYEEPSKEHRTKPTRQRKTQLQDVRIGSFAHTRYRRKVLVISFLYDDQYYRPLAQDIHRSSLETVYPGLLPPHMETLSFYPGYLTAEDLVSKIIRRLDRAILEGDPFTGVLLDGLHNVFLQFRNLQKHDMIWPLLYSILSRYDLTVVSTFTNFAMNGRLVEVGPADKNSMMHAPTEDQSLMKEGMVPFLHMLVKATDFYLLLEEHVNQDDHKRRYYIAVKSAQKQTLPERLLEWDRQDLVIKAQVDPGVLIPKDSFQAEITSMTRALNRLADLSSKRSSGRKKS